MIGIVAAVLIILVQIILHKNLKLVQPSQGEKIHFELAHGEQAMKSIEEQFSVYHIEVLNVKANRLSDDKMEVDFFCKVAEFGLGQRNAAVFPQEPRHFVFENVGGRKKIKNCT